MIRFKALGTLDLRDDDGRPLQTVLAQPKRQALLAYLALATPRGFHRRDTIVGLLWPEAGEAQARNSLNKGVHHLRAALGADVVVSGGKEELALDFSCLWSDVVGFEDALDRGELAEALALYRGPLLPGFFVDETPEFDRWLETERARLQHRAVQAARLLSEREEAAGRWITAVEWARRAVTLAPLDEPALRRVMILLDQGNDRAGALREYEDFAKRLRTELGAEPDDATRTLRDGLRSRGGVAASPAPPSPPPAPPPAPQPVAPIVTDVVPIAAAPSTGSGAVLAPSPRFVPNRRLFAAAGILLLITAAWIAWQVTGPAAANADSATVAVHPLDVTGTPPFAGLGDSIVAAISAELSRSTEMHPVRARARHRFAVRGTAAANANLVRVDATLFDTLRGPDPVARVAAEGAPTEVPRIASDLAWQLIQVRQLRRDDTASAHTRTPSPAVVIARGRGDSAYFAGRFADAVEAYRRAVDADTTIGGSYLAVTRAAIWENNSSIAHWAAQQAVLRIKSLHWSDALQARTWDAYLGSRAEESERLARVLLANHPYNSEAWYALGENLFHWGPYLGRPRGDAAQAFEQVAMRQRYNVAPLIHLARIAGVDGAPRDVDSLVAQALGGSPDATQSLELRGLRAFAGTKADERSGVLAQLGRLDDETAYPVASMIAIAAAERRETAALTDALTATRRSIESKRRSEILGLQLELARGRLADAVSRLAASRVIPPSRILEFRAAFMSRPFVAVSAAALDSLRAALRATPPDSTGGGVTAMNGGLSTVSRPYLLGILSVRLGDTVTAAGYADSLEAPVIDRAYGAQRAGVARIVRAHILRASGQPEAALAMITRALPLPAFGLPSVLNYFAADARFLRAELLLELGRDAEALRWYSSFPDPTGSDLAYIAPALLRRAAIHARRGEREMADSLRGRAGALWAGADSSVRAWPTDPPPARLPFY
jgi:DNA-binding SARP family transcriptional activator